TVEYELEPGEEMIVSTGHVAMMSATCTMDIRTVPGVKNVLFGGEGLFHTVIKGPGKLMLQTMPAINVANALIPYLPKQSN
ncbi:MAG: AIM24 family protein, partial [Lachnospiraceae bacterium]|nr:AIM24 family protein [Lachnospiraceae bacterium]